MTTMIERVARAICAARHDEFNDWNSLGSDEVEQFKNEARSAIEAMRGPTGYVLAEMMEQVTRWQNEQGTDQDIWEAGIDAALNEKEPT